MLCAADLLVSRSPRGWINDVEREVLILLAEALDTLGDRSVIYGFSGWTRKRCEAFRVKDFDEPWDDNVIGRVCRIEPKDHTRMDAPIRHLVSKLRQVEARTRLLITLSDGKPDAYAKSQASADIYRLQRIAYLGNLCAAAQYSSIDSGCQRKIGYLIKGG